MQSFDGPCGPCLISPPPFDAVHAPFRYAWPVDRMIQQFKYRGRLHYGRVLASLLARHLAALEALPGCLVPVPLHRRRLRQRGFNQACEIARVLARELGIANWSEGCIRLHDTPEQSGLSARARRENLRDAFTVATALPARHVAIVDDVLTTGATVGALAWALRRAGAKRIEVWTIARA